MLEEFWRRAGCKLWYVEILICCLCCFLLDLKNRFYIIVIFEVRVSNKAGCLFDYVVILYLLVKSLRKVDTRLLPDLMSFWSWWNEWIFFHFWYCLEQRICLDLTSRGSLLGVNCESRVVSCNNY